MTGSGSEGKKDSPRETYGEIQTHSANDNRAYRANRAHGERSEIGEIGRAGENICASR